MNGQKKVDASRYGIKNIEKYETLSDCQSRNLLFHWFTEKKKMFE